MLYSLRFYLHIHIFYGRPCESKLGSCVTLGMVGDISLFITTIAIFCFGVSLLNRVRSHTSFKFVCKVMPTATGKAWYLLRNVASKLSRMEHHHQFLRTCYEEKVIPIGHDMKINIGFQLYEDMLSKYTADNSSFIFHRIQRLAADAFTVMNDLCKEFTSIEISCPKTISSSYR